MSNISGTMHLKIIKGIAKVPGDSQSSEVGLDEVNLLDPNGFSCDEYLIRIPTLKSSAVYADSPLTDGRTLISGTLGNVTETIRLTLNADTLIQMAAMLSKLGRFKQDCNDFWDTFGQIEPVYIKHQIAGEPGPRYALLYDIDVDVESPTNPNDTIRIVTLSIEREYGWRGLAPGDNPKKWAIGNLFTNQKLNSDNAGLLTGNNFLHYEENIWNRAELRSNQSGYNVKNFVDIPAANIPGDLPALLCLSYSRTSAGINDSNLFISKSTKKNSGNISRSSGSNQILIHVFNAADASVGTDTTLAADTGASKGMTGLQRRSQTTFGTATMQTRLTWSGNNYTANGLSLSVMRGRYAVFTRARLSASSTTVNLQLNFQEGNNLDQTLTPVAFTNEGNPTGTGNTTSWGVAYLGQVTLPSSDRKTIVSANGMGTEVYINTHDAVIELNASRTAGAGVLYVNDLIFMPADEGAVMLSATGDLSQTGGGGAIYDNTGYLQHGTAGEFAMASNGGGSIPYGEFDRLTLSGSPIYLTPGTDNRLEFFNYNDSDKFSLAVFGGAGVIVRASIVPRWIGYRDV